MIEVEVRSKVVAGAGMAPVWMGFERGRVAVRELIGQAVEEQIGAVAGVFGEVERACAAFERRGFAIFVGGRQVESLDETVELAAGTPVVFLRLTPLVGG